MKTYYITDGNNIVQQTQYDVKEGYKSTTKTIVRGMIDNGDNTFSIPTPTQAELDAKIYQDRWNEYDLYQLSLSVNATSTNKYDVSKSGLAQIIAKRDSVTDTETFLWVETWGSFDSNKVELQEVIMEANRLLQAKIDELFGVL